MIDLPKQGDPSLVYMYGMSDFWVDMFGDHQLVESLLAGETAKLGEAYSYFLQRSAGISLIDIQDKYQTRLKLLLLSEDDLVDPSDLTSFKLDESIEDIQKLSNRPILPTQCLSYGVHFDIDGDTLKLYKPLNELKFPVRYTSDGKWQYAIWMSDVEVNEKWIENSFGRLVGFTEDDAIFNYKSFLEGVYFLYTNGPNISFIERGVNLAMGMPYARATESILEIYQDEVTSNWVIFTPTQSYEIPYSFKPDLQPGDVLTEGDVLTTWVEVIDYSTSGAWWYQIYLPREVLGNGVDPVELGKAVEGSTADKMMDDFLKHHMFEVLITQPSSDITAFNTAKGLILNAKPEYTYPIFVWRASVDDEIINLEDDLTYTYKADRSDYCVSPPSVRFMDRGEEDNGFVRGTNWYNRFQGSMYAATLIGYGDWQGNGGWAPQFEDVEDRYLSYMAPLMRNRGDTVSPTNRGTVMRGWRGVDNEEYNDLTWVIKTPDVFGGDGLSISVSQRDLTPLYLMNSAELVDKMLTINPTFTLGNRSRLAVKGLNLVTQFDTWMIRNEEVEEDQSEEFTFSYTTGDLDIFMSPLASQSYVPNRSDMFNSEGMPIDDGELFLTKTGDNSWICNWIRRDIVKAPTMMPVEDLDYTRAIENYSSSKLGSTTTNFGISILEGLNRVQTPKFVESSNELLVTVDGGYVSTFDYNIDIENISVEPDDMDLGIPGRSFVTLGTAPEVSGYAVYDEPSPYNTVEEQLVKSGGVFTLTETVSSKTKLLVIHEGNFIFDYSLTAGKFISMSDSNISNITVRYVNYTSEETLSAGMSSYTLNSSLHCKIFIGGKLLEEWRIVKDGFDITFPFVTTEDVIVKYGYGNDTTIESLFDRSTVERNKARFLMDRSREEGKYEDGLGNTVFMNRGGAPTLDNGDPAESFNVIRRLR